MSERRFSRKTDIRVTEDLLDRYLGRESEICVEATIVFRVWRLTVTGLGIGVGVCIWSVRGFV